MGWLATIAPRWALRRAVARAQIARLEAYRVATQSDLRTRVRDKGAGNAVMATSGPTMRNWARHLSKNSPLARSVIRYLASKATSCTISANAQLSSGRPAERYNEAMDTLWREHCDALDAQGLLDWHQLAMEIGRSWVRDGEVFPRVLLARRDVDYPSGIPIAIEALESDYLPYTQTLVQGRHVHGHEIERGRVVAYHLHTEHPGDYLMASRRTLATERVPAQEILALRNVERLGQLRGVTMLDAVIETLSDLDEYLVAERVAAKFAACIGVQITRSADLPPDALNTQGERTIAFEPGMTLDNLLPGERAEMMSMSRPTEQFEAYLLSLGRQVSSGTGAQYSAVTNDFSGSYSSQRQMMVTSAQFELHLHRVATARFFRPLWRSFVSACEIAGKLPSTLGVKPSTLLDAEFVPAPQPWIDPQREAQADAIALDGRLESRQGLIRRRGGDARRIDREIAQDEASTPPRGAAPRDAGASR